MDKTVSIDYIDYDLNKTLTIAKIGCITACRTRKRTYCSA